MGSLNVMYQLQVHSGSDRLCIKKEEVRPDFWRSQREGEVYMGARNSPTVGSS